HAFGESDQQLLETLAGSLSVALENARLVHETRQRNAELALINSVQDAIAGELEPQAIYDAVGDRIQDVFDAQTVIIATIDEATGVISLQTVVREHAFDEADQQLLTTVAGSLSVALENARLVQETRQRVSELATVNSVGQAISSQLDLDVLIERVGEQVRETFGADIAYVALHDRTSGTIDFAYYYESGERSAPAPIAYGEGLTSRIIESR